MAGRTGSYNPQAWFDSSALLPSMELRTGKLTTSGDSAPCLLPERTGRVGPEAEWELSRYTCHPVDHPGLVIGDVQRAIHRTENEVHRPAYR